MHIMPLLPAQLHTHDACRRAGGAAVRGLDVGCGANMIYCLLGAAIYGWHMVGLDVTDVAQSWCERHISANPQLSDLLEFKRSSCQVRGVLACIHAMVLCLRARAHACMPRSGLDCSVCRTATRAKAVASPGVGMPAQVAKLNRLCHHQLSPGAKPPPTTTTCMPMCAAHA